MYDLILKWVGTGTVQHAQRRPRPKICLILIRAQRSQNMSDTRTVFPKMIKYSENTSINNNLIRILFRETSMHSRFTLSNLRHDYY